MTTQKSTSVEQKDERSTAREKSYISYIERYSLYPTLIVLKDYEDQELYEECAIIRDALASYKVKYKTHFPNEFKFPSHLSDFNSQEYQAIFKKLDITFEEKSAKEKAKFIKLNLPVK